MYKKAIVGMVAFALMTVLFAACNIVDAASLNNGPQAHMGNAAFKETSINLKKGQKLVLVDDVAVQHIIVNGSWNGATQVPKLEPGAPKVNVSIAGGSSAVGPFTQAGTFSLYCTIHAQMQIKVIVS
jgi:plastocyanin